MTEKAKLHPITQMSTNAQHLREQAMFAARQAENGAHKAQQASADLAELDLETIFSQLRQMVEMVGGKPANAKNNTLTFPTSAEKLTAQAAE